MKKKCPYSMCVLYRDDGSRVKHAFDSKNSALHWFETFQQENTRSVTVTFYCGLTPYWVYRKN